MLFAATASANDAAYFTSGNQLIPVKETDISIRKEILTIGLQDDGKADVTVYYEFILRTTMTTNFMPMVFTRTSSISPSR